MKPIISLLLLSFTLSPFAVAQTPTIGTTEPIRQVDMAFPESGVIASIPAQEGQVVREGELLGKLDSQVLDASLRIAKIRAESQSTIQSAQANWELRKRRKDELERLAKSGSANRDEVARANAEFEISNAELIAAKEEKASLAIQVERIAAEIERHTLRSPFDGIVSRIYREVGENVQPGQGPVLTLVKLDQLNVVLHVPHQAAEHLKPGQTVPLQKTNGTREYLAKLEFVSPVTDAASSTTRVKLVLENPSGEHRSGTKYLVDLSRIGEPIALSKP
tara:strand:- start:1787 stop:2617 length:831 start_codon:yes stop_codon:yes gene_type:complete